MADVVNLGQFSAPRNPMEGLSDSLAKGLAIGETKRSNLATERQNVENTKINQELKRAELSSALAKETFDQDQKNKQMAMNKYKEFSLVYAQMPEDKRQLFEQSDAGREYFNYTKKYLGPEFVDAETKTVRHLPPVTVFEDKIKQNLAEVQQRVLNGTATDTDKEYITMFHNNPNNINVAASAVASVMSDPMIDKSDPIEVSKAIAERSKSIIQAQNLLNPSSKKQVQDDSSMGGIPGMNLLTQGLQQPQQ